MPVYSLIYASSAVRPFTTEDLHALLDASRTRNAADGITGMLLYKDGNFLQLLEGEQAAVERTFQRIQRDPRHRGSVILRDAHEPEPLYAEWAMGFVDLTQREGTPRPGFSQAMNERWLEEEPRAPLPPRERTLWKFRQRM